MKKNLFITTKVKIHRDAKSLKIIENGTSIATIPLGIIENIFLIGNYIVLTNSARSMLLEHNKSIYYYSSNYNLQGVLSNTKLTSNYRNRLFQYNAYNSKILDMAKYIVYEKISSIENKMHINLSKFKDKLETFSTINEILGIEGICSNIMFKKIKKVLHNNDIDEFKKREYHPPKDKVNSLLSFAYTLYSNLLYGLVMSQGYDPYIGFLHKKRGTHYAFVSDLIEFDRVTITVFVINLFINNILTDDCFDGIYLTKNGRKIFLEKFNEFVEYNFDKSKSNLVKLGEQLI